MDDWGTFYYGKSCPKWSVTEDSTTPCIRYGELYTKFGAKIDRVYSYTNMSPENLRFSKGTEVLIPRVGEDPMDYNHCTWLSMPNVAIGEMISVFNTDNNPLFTAMMFNATLQNEFAMRVEGGSVTNLYFEKLKSIEVSFPSIPEQEKIAAYFDSIDHLITLHQRKYLQEKKTSLTWEQCKLEDVMDTVTDYVAAGSFEDIRNNVTYLNEPGYAQLVRTVDLKKKFTNNDSVYVDESAFKYLWRVNLNDECIVLPNIGANIGEVYFVEPSGLPYDNNVLGPNAILLKANEDTYFAFTALNNLTFQKQLFENVGSSGQPKFNKTKLKSIQLYMPQNEEQVKIGQYFRQLDHLITLHRRAHFHRRRRTYK